MKRILLIIAIIIVLLGLAVGAYFLFFAPDRPALQVGENPFGSSGDALPSPGTSAGSDEIILRAGADVGPSFVRITEGPVVPQAVAFSVLVPETGVAAEATTTPDGATTTPETITADKRDVEVRYIERASGNVYSYLAHERTLKRIGNRTLPGIQEASWTSNGSFAYARFVTAEQGTDTTETYVLPASGDGGYFLEPNLAQASVYGTDTFFALTTNSNGSIGSVGTPNGQGVTTLFSSTLSALRVHLSAGDFIGVTKPVATLPGYAFLIDRESGTFTRALGPLQGLTALPSPSGTKVLYSHVVRGRTTMAVFDTEAKTSVGLPVVTIAADKCVWAPDETRVYCGIPRTMEGTQPDDWYQGAASFSDRIWSIDLAERIAELELDPLSASDIDIDAVGFTLDADADVLVFSNRKDGSLYALDL